MPPGAGSLEPACSCTKPAGHAHVELSQTTVRASAVGPWADRLSLNVNGRLRSNACAFLRKSRFSIVLGLWRIWRSSRCLATAFWCLDGLCGACEAERAVAPPASAPRQTTRAVETAPSMGMRCRCLITVRVLALRHGRARLPPRRPVLRPELRALARRP